MKRQSALFLSVLLSIVTSCAEPLEPLEERVDRAPIEVAVEEPIAFTTEPYQADFKGERTIASVREVIDADAFVWHGFGQGDAYPVSGDCEPDRRGVQAPVKVEALPATVRGVVTIYPRYFMKPSICGSDERYYGSFFIQDASGGMLVMRDSRTAGFTFGDVVELRARGVMKFFDYDAILAFDNFKVVTSEYVKEGAGAEAKKAIYADAITRAFVSSDQGSVKRVTGVVTQEATNNNFNEMRLKSADGQIEWIVSLDREVGQRNPDWKLGDTLEVTGPVLNSFGLKIIVMSYGQVKPIEP